jgi:hypothetical protein
MFDTVLLVIWLVVTWCVAGEGPFGAAVNCVVVVISGLLAMNFFEPAAAIGQSIIGGGAWIVRWDIIALVGLFAVFVTVLRMLLEKLSPLYIQIGGLAHELGRWGFGLVAGYVTMAFLLTALHTAPLPRTFMEFTPERANLFGVLAPDRQWLGFAQYSSETLFATGNIFDGPEVDFINDPQNVASNTIWPSFPIRYATRRAMYASGGGSGPAAAPQAPARRRSTGGGGGF